MFRWPAAGSRTGTSPARGAFLVGLAVTVALTGVLIWGALAPGYLLYRDFVTVPVPVLNAAALGAGGAPRAVPLDLVTAAASWLVPSWLVQKILLVAPLLLAGSGVSFVLRHRGSAATIVGSALAVWNPYVAERLLLGQSPTLLGYAMIPWLFAAVRAQRPRGRRIALVALAAAPAALTPVGAVMALVTVVVASATLARPAQARSGRGVLAEVGLLSLPVLVLCLPWIVAGLRDPARGATSSGATAFAVAPDSPLGVVGSVLTLGGVWAPGAHLASRATAPALIAELALVVVAIGSWWGLRKDPRRRPAADLALAAYALVACLVLLFAGPALPLWRSAQLVPGVAIFRDTHRLLGFAAMSLALLCGMGAAQAAQALARLGGARRWLPSAAVVVAVAGLGLLSAPDLAARLSVVLRPVSFPEQWAQVVATVDGPAPGGSSADGSVLILPWQPFRQTPWARSQPFLDPLPRALTTGVVSARDLLVRRGERAVWVGGEDPSQAQQWRRGRVDSAELRRLKVSWLVEWLDSPGALPTGHQGMTRVLDGAQWRVWKVN